MVTNNGFREFLKSMTEVHGHFYDKSGAPISLEQFGALQQDRDYTQIALTRIEPGIQISTVWLGLDYALLRNKIQRPLIFETMVFAEAHEALDGDMKRYSTEKQARAGHDGMVAEVLRYLAESKDSP